MSAFGDLLSDADRLGVTKLVWECDVRGYRESPEKEGRWTCRASTPKLVVGTIEADGRTGEESLRRVVEFLKATE